MGQISGVIHIEFSNGDDPLSATEGSTVEILNGGALKLVEPSQVEGERNNKVITIFAPSAWTSATYVERPGRAMSL